MRTMFYTLLFLIISFVGWAQSPTDFNFKLPYAETGNPYGISSNAAYTDALAQPRGCKLIANGIYWGNENPPTDYYSELTINSSVQINDVYNFTGLSPSTTYYYKQVVQNCFGTFSTPVYDFTTTATGSTPTVTTTTATSITSSTASTGGNVTNDGGSTVTSRGVYYSTIPAPINGTTTGSGTGSYTTNLSSLAAGTKYYYRAFAINSTGTGYGSELNFTTSVATGVPTVTTTTAIAVTTNSAISGGNVTYDGNATVTERGVYYSTSPTPTSGISSGNGTGTYSTTLSSLTPNTTYYYRAYAKNTSGTGYGAELSFTTLNVSGLATVTTTTATAITTGLATVGGNVTADGGSTVTARGVCYGTSPNPTTGYSTTGGTGSFSVQISYLTPGTRYYYRAYAINSSGTAYGAEYDFTTLIPFSVPVLSTVTAIEITDSTAMAGGNITYDGNSQILQSGVCYSTFTNPTTANSLSLSSAIIGNYYVMLPDLLPSTTYYYRAYAINSIGTGYGSVLSFTTASTSATLPTVVVNNMTSAGVTTATGGGAVTYDGGATVINRGLVWNTTGNPSLYNSVGKTDDGSGEGAFSSTLNTLTCGTTYYVKAYAINSAGTAYSSDQITFTTTSNFTNEYKLYSVVTTTSGTVESFFDKNIYEVRNICNALHSPPLPAFAAFNTLSIDGVMAVGKQFYKKDTCEKYIESSYFVYAPIGLASYISYPYPVYIVYLTSGVVTSILEWYPD